MTEFRNKHAIDECISSSAAWGVNLGTLHLIRLRLDARDWNPTLESGV